MVASSQKASTQKVLLKGGRVINPATKLDEVMDVLMFDGVIKAIKYDIDPSKADEVIQLTPDHWVTPGLIDIHVHFRDLTQSDKETIETGSASAIAGGYTSVCIMPNTLPTLDNVTVLEMLQPKMDAVPLKIYPVMAVTHGIAGETLTEMITHHQRGAVAFTDDGRCVMNAELMRRALLNAKQCDAPIMCHEEDYDLVGDGCMNEGPTSVKLGVKGHPNAAESVMVARDVELARQTGGHVHICHISTREAVEWVRVAKAQGLPVTAEVTPHHFSLTDEALAGGDPDYKMCPPLRSESDRLAMIEGLKDGTIDAIATDHAPHRADEKARPLTQAPNGVVGLETAVGVGYTTLVKAGHLTPMQWVDKMTAAPAALGKLAGGNIHPSPENAADVTVIDTTREWTVEPEKLSSKSKNTCFKGHTLTGKAVVTIIDGEVVMNNMSTKKETAMA